MIRNHTLLRIEKILTNMVANTFAVTDVATLSGVTAIGPGDSQYILSKKELTVCVVAANVTSGGEFTFEGSPDEINWGTVGSVDVDGVIASTRAITANGVYFFEIVNASSLKYFRVNLTSVTDGTYTVYLTARA